MPRRRLLATLACLAVSTSLAPAARASFVPLGVVDGLAVNAISADGSYIVGSYTDTDGFSIAMRWNITGTDPPEDLGELPSGAIGSEAHATSADGSAVVGESLVASAGNPNLSVSEAFLWEDGTMTGLGFLQQLGNNDQSVALAVSADGAVIAGHSRAPDPGNPSKRVSEAFRWEGGVMTGLGFLADDGNDYASEALAISGDGEVVVGRASNTDPNNPSKSVDEAFRWEGGVMAGLGFLQDDTAKVRSEATGISLDGSTVIGNSNVDHPDTPSASVTQAFVWRDGAMTGLGFLASSPGPYQSLATGVSADGSVVVGTSKTAVGPEAFIWSEETGEMRSLRAAIEEDLGVDLTGWTLDQAPVISADGSTLVALATNPDGEIEAFVTYLPEPASGLYAGVALLIALQRRRRARD
ncbi:MAG TPA: PEP-CTERM sorting domain-containing protein [Myxococcota bacterium]|nr:PEP-CTERM sorting domain-containing protein [Myxococcota bacterium]